MSALENVTAITLDLDDTLWPVRPTLVAAEKVLAAWLHAHAPATAPHADGAATRTPPAPRTHSDRY